MSASKRRVKRKITMLVRMLETVALMPWNRGHRTNAEFPLEIRQQRLFKNIIALGKALGRKGYEARTRAAIDESILANSVLRKE